MLLLPLTGMIAIACTSDKREAKFLSSSTKTDTIRFERRIYHENGYLAISNKSKDSFYFSLEAYSGGCISAANGFAIKEGNAFVCLKTESDEDCGIVFNILSDSSIRISETGICLHGLNSTTEGVYIRENPNFNWRDTITLYGLGVFSSPKEDSLFKKLVGNNYPLFLYSAQIIKKKELLLKKEKALLYRCYPDCLEGYQENIIIRSNDKMWAALLNGDTVYYYANSVTDTRKPIKEIIDWQRNLKVKSAFVLNKDK